VTPSSRNASQASRARGRSWCLEEVWAWLKLLTNRHKKRHGIFPMLASMFGGCGERQSATFIETSKIQKSKTAKEQRDRCQHGEDAMPLLMPVSEQLQMSLNFFQTSAPPPSPSKFGHILNKGNKKGSKGDQAGVCGAMSPVQCQKWQLELFFIENQRRRKWQPKISVTAFRTFNDLAGLVERFSC
jgi:hypothetical protein